MQGSDIINVVPHEWLPALTIVVLVPFLLMAARRWFWSLPEGRVKSAIKRDEVLPVQTVLDAIDMIEEREEKLPTTEMQGLVSSYRLRLAKFPDVSIERVLAEVGDHMKAFAFCDPVRLRLFLNLDLSRVKALSDLDVNRIREHFDKSHRAAQVAQDAVGKATMCLARTEKLAADVDELKPKTALLEADQRRNEAEFKRISAQLNTIIGLLRNGNGGGGKPPSPSAP